MHDEESGMERLRAFGIFRSPSLDKVECRCYCDVEQVVREK